MNDRQSAKLNMIGQVKEVCARHRATWEANKGFNRGVETLEGTFVAINNTNLKLQGTDQGATEDKTEQKKQIAKYAVKISGALQAYAHSENKKELALDATVGIEDILRAKEVDADDIALHIHELGTKHLVQLMDYGITQDDLNALAGSVKQFTSSIGKPRLNQTERKLLNELQEANFSIADKALQKVLDNLILQYEDKDKAFYDAYLSARSVIRQGSRSVIADPVQN